MKPWLDELSPEVRAELAKPVQSYDPRDAQLGGSGPQWFIAEVRNRDAEEELVKRRFGIYVPECEETIVSRGRKVERRTRLFPGYVFVFMWSTDENWCRLAAIDGVAAIIGTVEDEAVDRIRYLENCHRPIAVEWFEEVREVPHKRKRKRKRHVKVMVPDEILSIRTWSAFEDALPTLDSQSRNQVLRQILSS